MSARSRSTSGTVGLNSTARARTVAPVYVNERPPSTAYSTKTVVPPSSSQVANVAAWRIASPLRSVGQAAAAGSARVGEDEEVAVLPRPNRSECDSWSRVLQVSAKLRCTLAPPGVLTLSVDRFQLVVTVSSGMSVSSRIIVRLRRLTCADQSAMHASPCLRKPSTQVQSLPE